MSRSNVWPALQSRERRRGRGGEVGVITLAAQERRFGFAQKAMESTSSSTGERRD